MSGVPYSPIVPSLIRWQSGHVVAQGKEQVERPDHVRVLGLDRRVARLHRVRRRGLLAVVDDDLGLKAGDHGVEELAVGDVADMSLDLVSGDLLPRRDPLDERRQRRQRVGRLLEVPAAAGEVVDDGDLVPPVAETQRRRPAEIAIAP